MICSEVIKYLENWAPKQIAWQNDNVGLQIGCIDNKIKNIILSLELTHDVVKQALKNKCNLIITHHPLIFHPIKNLDLKVDTNAQLIEQLIKNDITLYSAHTNLDFTKHGVSFQLAKKLGLKNIKFLKNLKSNQFKLSVFVPKTHTEKVASAIFDAGGGEIGEYSGCSFRTEGFGTFRGSSSSNPKVGIRNRFEKVNETKLEILVDSWKMRNVLQALMNTHPYEEPAYDIYPLENYNVDFGAGAIGSFEKDYSPSAFLELIAKRLKLKNMRYVHGSSKRIKTAAVCGGSGSDLINDAINSKADAFITADIKYHTFHAVNKKLLLIDAGHYETEIPIIDELHRRLSRFVKRENQIKILKFKGNTNPVNFYN